MKPREGERNHWKRIVILFILSISQPIYTVFYTIENILPGLFAYNGVQKS